METCSSTMGWRSKEIEVIACRMINTCAVVVLMIERSDKVPEGSLLVIVVIHDGLNLY